MKLLLVLSATLLAATAFGGGVDVTDMLTEAQRAYIRGDVEAAKEKFELVRKIDPDNRIAVGYLRRIIAEEMKDAKTKGPPNATEATLRTIILPKVQFVESSVGEALEFLRQKGNQIGEGKVAINFVMQLDEETKGRKITLSLQNVPFTEVVRYLGELAGLQFTYDHFAIVVKPKGAAPTNPTAGTQPAPASANGVKIEGL